jgi:hypothetical protein
MTTDSTLRSDATLPELLVARAHRASDLRLAADVAGGVLVAAAALFWRPRGWVVPLGAALCFAAFGLWGIADRALGAPPPATTFGAREPASRDALRALRALAVVLGTLAALVLVGGIVAVALGTIIS